MAKKKQPRNTVSGALSAEDAELWQRVAGSADPLQRGKNRVVKKAEPLEMPEPAVSRPVKSSKADQPKKKPSEPKPAAPPPVGSYARREARAIAKGRVDIDARIDLHGMRQGEAHSALRAFLLRAQAQGYRHVLVITGKGRRHSDEGPIERGVLNREVPRWLGEPEFRALVVGFSPAHKRHGGEGALYVRVRRNKPA